MLASFVLFLFVFWTLFGSFASVIIYRLKSWEKGMWGGRSHCTSCQKTLGARDLVPIFSYLLHWGKCRQCDTKVSHIYPLLEITMWLAFAGIGYFGVDALYVIWGNFLEIGKLVFLLFLTFCLVVLSFYDILFLEIPEEILVIAIIGAFCVLMGQSFFPEMQILPKFTLSQNSFFIGVLWSLVAASIILWMYVIMTQGLTEKYDFLILALSGLLLLWLREWFNTPFSSLPVISGVVAAYAIFLFFYLQIFVSSGAWLWGWDLRIAILMGLVLWMSLSFYGVFLTYISGSIIGISIIVYKKLIEKVKWRVNTMIPFWPFLAIGIYVTLLFYPYIQSFVTVQ